jgi:hypothetical protein
MAAPGGALLATARAWHVFPVRGMADPEAPKSPPPGWRWKTRHTTDAATARRWLDGRTAYGIACGPSRLVVLDLDVAKDGAGETGETAFKALCEAHGEPWPVTYTVATPAGGKHLYFRASPEHKIGNGDRNLPPLIDVRGTGGYVVGAGSVIPGGEYRVCGSVLMLASLPGWLARLITEPPTADTPQVTRAVAAPGRYAQAALDRHAVKVAAATKPGRNNQLNASAWSLAGFPEPVLPAAAIIASLVPAAREAGLPEWRIWPTIQSALRARRGRPNGGHAAGQGH